MLLSAEISNAFPWVLPVVVFVLGACVGSFLNVVILRNPLRQSVLGPRSRCAACGAPILGRDNIPIFGWLLRGGRARCCGARFPFRYCAIELATALLFLGCWLICAPAKAVCGMLFVSLLLVASFIDLDHGIIPDWLTVGGAAAGLFLSLCFPELHGPLSNAVPFAPDAHFHSLLASVHGLLIGSGLLLWIGLVAEVFLKREAMGFGDVKFVGLIGAFCGWQGAVVAIFGGAILGTLALSGLWFFRKTCLHGKGVTSLRPIEGASIPFGPMLAAGALVHFFGDMMVAGDVFSFVAY